MPIAPLTEFDFDPDATVHDRIRTALGRSATYWVDIESRSDLEDFGGDASMYLDTHEDLRLVYEIMNGCDDEGPMRYALEVAAWDRTTGSTGKLDKQARRKGFATTKAGLTSYIDSVLLPQKLRAWAQADIQNRYIQAMIYDHRHDATHGSGLEIEGATIDTSAAATAAVTLVDVGS